jgi:hypothetical protein
MLRRRGLCDPCADEPRGSPGRHGCACAGGTRGYAPGGGCSAGKYACSRLDLPMLARQVQLSPSRPDGAQDSPTTDGRPSQSTAPRSWSTEGATRRHATRVGCLPTPTSCGMSHGLLACVLLVGQREWEPAAPQRTGRGLWRVPLRSVVPSCTVVDNSVDAAHASGRSCRSPSGGPHQGADTARGNAVMVQGQLGQHGGEGSS